MKTFIILTTLLFSGVSLASWTPLGYSSEQFNALQDSLDNLPRKFQYFKVGSVFFSGNKIAHVTLKGPEGKIKIITFTFKESNCGYSVCPLKAYPTSPIN